MGTHTPHPDVNTSSLWKEAYKNFTESNPKADFAILKRNETPKSLTTYLRRKKEQAARKYQRCGTVFERLDVIAGIGDIAMRTAPESVTLVWSGFRFVFEDTITTARDECQKLRDLDDVDFKEEFRGASKQFRTAIEDLSTSFKSKLDHLAAELTRLREQSDETKIDKEFACNNEWFQRGQIAGRDDPSRHHKENLGHQHEGSCKWIFEKEVTEYQNWIERNAKKVFKTWQGGLASHRLLWLHGDGGVGKSVLVSAIIRELEYKKEHVVCFFCKLGDESSQNGAQIMLHLCAQLFQKGSNVNLDLRRELNGIIDEMREDSPDPSNIPTTTARSLFQELVKALGKDVTIAVDGLDECIDYNKGLLKDLKLLARSNARIRVLVSSRSSPKPPDMPNILIDKSRTESDIRTYVTKHIRVEWAIEEIVKKSEGRFRLVRSLSGRMKDLPNTMNDLYRQKFDLLNEFEKDNLITVFRWLICRGDRIHLQPIADELAQKYSQEATSDNNFYATLQEVGKSLAEIGRDFLKVTGTIVQLDHNSVRDFIHSSSQKSQGAGSTCSKCGKRDPLDILSQAAGKDGKLMMAEYMVQTINSVEFQEKFILFDESESSAKAKGPKSSPKSMTIPWRYEVSLWCKHLRDAEAAWTASERESLPRWKALYDKADRFLSQDSKVYQDWLKRVKSFPSRDGIDDHPLYTASRFGLEGLIKRYLDWGHDVNVKNQHQIMEQIRTLSTIRNDLVYTTLHIITI
ncbi:hypothetical protein Daus18300_012107 [Diaporthe australafricana]|uniref:NACHT domain-containing protein n=1 Tax=Diaporthe australafricana TaxID=127596 RepID=A0ABR3W411_9PEZI